MPPELSDEHVAAICGVLIDHGVQFVIIGGMAARLHDTGHATVDADICPSTDDANLARLASALADLGARLRVSGDLEGVAFEPHADMLRQVELMTLITEHGPLEVGRRARGSYLSCAGGGRCAGSTSSRRACKNVC